MGYIRVHFQVTKFVSLRFEGVVDALLVPLQDHGVCFVRCKMIGDLNSNETTENTNENPNSSA